MYGIAARNMIAMRTIIRNEDVNNWCNVIRHIQKLKVGLLVYVTIKLAGHPQLRMGIIIKLLALLQCLKVA